MRKTYAYVSYAAEHIREPIYLSTLSLDEIYKINKDDIKVYIKDVGIQSNNGYVIAYLSKIDQFKEMIK
jgi:hypothetical protein